MKKLLLHTCCAPCSGFLAREFSRDFKVTVFFDNSNIFPLSEFEKRKKEAEDFFQKEKMDFLETGYDHEAWLRFIKGLEKEKEKGKRCVLCYYFRLERTVQWAKKNSFDLFATTLSISPHKKARVINNLGKALEKKYGVEFLSGDWKKRDGFKKAMSFSHERAFYHQHYCGCEFSCEGKEKVIE